MSPAHPSDTVALAKDLAAQLPHVAADVARLSRTVLDRRFSGWLADVVQAGPVRVSMAQTRPAVCVALACDDGMLEVAVDPAAWPAIGMACDLPDEALARDVTAALVKPIIDRLAAELPGLEVRATRRTTQCKLRPLLRFPLTRLALVALDTGAARHVDRALRGHRALAARAFATLRLPARVRLFSRDLSEPELSSLACGDVVVAGEQLQPGTAPWRACVIFGSGATMQAKIDLDAQTASARLAEDPYPAQEPDGDAADLTRLRGLTLPVSFEFDSARVSLEELAALGAGSTLELDVPVMEAMVRIVCHGQTVGIGQLVAVGDRVGVRIERMGLQQGGDSHADSEH